MSTNWGTLRFVQASPWASVLGTATEAKETEMITEKIVQNFIDVAARSNSLVFETWRDAFLPDPDPRSNYKAGSIGNVCRRRRAQERQPLSIHLALSLLHRPEDIPHPDRAALEDNSVREQLFLREIEWRRPCRPELCRTGQADILPQSWPDRSPNNAEAVFVQVLSDRAAPPASDRAQDNRARPVVAIPKNEQATFAPHQGFPPAKMRRRKGTKHPGHLGQARSAFRPPGRPCGACSPVSRQRQAVTVSVSNREQWPMPFRANQGPTKSSPGHFRARPA